ncbi:MAG: hypothetical protein QOH97_4670 [Actinoplanes sp.]|jgi:3-hydroxyisobutyrate dehydrogenase-like beta-hydroxyacid dehydrogenase|nr:hypothetical protein [Actinoplanes sp.]
MTTIGFIGLGAMGTPLAGRLLDGHQVYGTSRTKAKAATLIEQGLIWSDTPRDVAAAADVIFSMVTDDTALAAITTGPRGILAGLRPGAIYVDMSTVSPEASRRLAGRVRSIGAAMIDAPVSGSVPAARTGTLTIMAGGPEPAFRAAEPLLRRLGDNVIHVGDNGGGLLLKLAINISLACQMLAFSEGMLLAQRGGIDPGLAAHVMASSPIGSPMLRTRAPLVLDLPKQAWFDMRLMHKDIRLALRAAHRTHVPMPAATAADHLLSLAEQTGYGDRDIAGMLAVLAAAPENATIDPATAHPAAA